MDIYHQTAAIFSAIQKLPITVKLHDGQENSFYAVVNPKKEAAIHIPKTSVDIRQTDDKWYLFYSGFEHELAHVVFGSDSDLMCKEVAKLPECWRTPGQFIMNVLEDVRIESLWGVLYYGSKKRFDRISAETLKNVNLKVVHDIPRSPEHLAAQLGAISLGVPPNPSNEIQVRFAAAVEKVRYKGMDATLLLWRKIMQYIIAHVVFIVGNNGANQAAKSGRGAQLQTCIDAGAQDAQDSGAQGAQDDGAGAQDAQDGAGAQDSGVQGAQDGAGAQDSGAQGAQDDGAGAQDSGVQGAQDGAGAQDAANHYNGILSYLSKQHKNSRYTSNNAKQIARQLKKTQTIDSALTTSAEKATAKIQEIVSKLKQRVVPLRPDILPLEKAPISFGISNFNMAYVQGVARALRESVIKFGKREQRTDEDGGTEIDITEYINWKINHRNPEFFIADASHKGFLIQVLLDYSSSMDHFGKYKQAVLVCELLRQGLSSYADVLVYSFSETQEAVHLYNYGKYDLQKSKSPFGGTPTEVALNSVFHIGMSKAHYYKRMIVLVTDGKPERRYKGFYELEKCVHDTTEMIRRRGVVFRAVNIISPGAHCLSDKHLSYMYGKDYITVHSDMVEKATAQIVLKEVFSTIKKQL